MEAQGIKLRHFLNRDAVPTGDTVVPPALEELSERKKRQVRFRRVHKPNLMLMLYGPLEYLGLLLDIVTRVAGVKFLCF